MLLVEKLWKRYLDCKAKLIIQKIVVVTDYPVPSLFFYYKIIWVINHILMVEKLLFQDYDNINI